MLFAKHGSDQYLSRRPSFISRFAGDWLAGRQPGAHGVSVLFLARSDACTKVESTSVMNNTIRHHTSYPLPVACGVCLCLLTLIVLSFLGVPPVEAIEPSPPCVSGPHSGILTVTQRWCASDSPHLVSNDLTVPSGMTLTVEAGSTVKVATAKNFMVEGHLSVDGVSGSKVVFTSQADSGHNEWNGVIVHGGTAKLTFAELRFAGRDNDFTDTILGGYHRSTLVVADGDLTMDNVTVHEMISGDYDNGVVVHNSTAVIQNSTFTGIGNAAGDEHAAPLTISGADSDVALTGNTFSDNYHDSIWLRSSASEGDALMGHDTTLTAQSTPVCYEYRDTFTVPQNMKVTLGPGVKLCSGRTYAKFNVQGQLDANGTSESPVIFTSLADSGNNQWAGIIVDGGTANLTYAEFRNAGRDNDFTDTILGAYHNSSLIVANGNLTMASVVVREMISGGYDNGVVVHNSTATIQNSTFTGIGDSAEDQNAAPLTISGANTVVNMTGNSFTGNYRDVVLLRDSAMMGHNTTLKEQDALACYEYLQDFTVPLNVRLTMEPGTRLCAGNTNVDFTVEGHLDALGTSSKPIVFTSIADSAPNQWSGLGFDGRQGQGTGHLRHVTVRYGGRGHKVLGDITGYYYASNIVVHGVQNGQLNLENITVSDIYHFDGWAQRTDYGLFVHNSNVTMSDSLVENCNDNKSDDSAIYIKGDSHLSIQDSIIQSNEGEGIVVEGNEALVEVVSSEIVNNAGHGVVNMGQSVVVLGGSEEKANAIYANHHQSDPSVVAYGAKGYDAVYPELYGPIIATYNWWGDATGPTHSANPGGKGEEVTDRVAYDPWMQASPSSPDVTEQLLQLSAPHDVSVGQTVNFGVYFKNRTSETLKNAIIVLEVPWRAEYRFSTNGGHFWPLHNHVIWKLGDKAPGETFEAVVQVRFLWHTPNWTIMPVWAAAAAANHRNPHISYEEHLNYEELVFDGEEELSQAEVDAILASDSELKALFDHVKAQGFEYYGNAKLLSRTGWGEWLELLLINRLKDGEIAAVRRLQVDGFTDRHIRHEMDGKVSMYTLSGGLAFDYLTSRWTYWGDMDETSAVANQQLAEGTSPAGCPQQWWDDCLRNCLIQRNPDAMRDRRISQSCTQCLECDIDCLDVCSECARDQWKERQNGYYTDCGRICANSNNWNNYTCDDNLVTCYDVPDTQSSAANSQYKITYVCNKQTCQYEEDPYREYCPHGCVYGDTAGGHFNADCIPCDELGWFERKRCIRALTAKDPNALYGPLTAVPGQTIEYEVEWENEGLGIAYGVYVDCKIPDEVDAGTLLIDGGGVYDDSTRTIRWEVGELAAGAGDSVTFEVTIPSATPIGTALNASAVVYFPSVPEVTPTNPIVTLVQEVAAYEQTVTTQEEQPLDITLTGFSPSGQPVSYVIVEYPSQGTLTGVPPNVTYLPTANSQGHDEFSFEVRAGDRSSVPAAVTINIQGAPDSTAPKVVVTSPYDGDLLVPTYAEALHDNVYAPSIWIGFNEPMDASTITGDTINVRDPSGKKLAGTVEYDAQRNRAVFVLNEPLEVFTEYTVTVKSSVMDFDGNTMGAAHAFTFGTGIHRVRLPLLFGTQ